MRIILFQFFCHSNRIVPWKFNLEHDIVVPGNVTQARTHTYVHTIRQADRQADMRIIQNRDSHAITYINICTDKQTHRYTDTQTHRHTDKTKTGTQAPQTHRHTDIQTQRNPDTHALKVTLTDWHKGRWTRHTDWQTADWLTETQIKAQTDRRTDTSTQIYIPVHLDFVFRVEFARLPRPVHFQRIQEFPKYMCMIPWWYANIQKLKKLERYT